jgi:hypothetical protein
MEVPMTRTILACGLGALLAAAAVHAETSPVVIAADREALNGGNGDLLLLALQTVAINECPRTLMTVLLARTCPQLREAIERERGKMGSVVHVTYRGGSQLPLWLIEEYVVHYQRGTQTWFIAVDRTGLIEMLWSTERAIPTAQR